MREKDFLRADDLRARDSFHAAQFSIPKHRINHMMQPHRAGQAHERAVKKSHNAQTRDCVSGARQKFLKRRPDQKERRAHENGYKRRYNRNKSRTAEKAPKRGQLNLPVTLMEIDDQAADRDGTHHAGIDWFRSATLSRQSRAL